MHIFLLIQKEREHVSDSIICASTLEICATSEKGSYFRNKLHSVFLLDVALALIWYFNLSYKFHMIIVVVK